ncbi:MAG: glucose 1-dehydrogenase [Gammaproteobacteria bacterium]|nr:glucose 1-dehydrogenase [Gammaproteobacteria bacterium]MDA8023708.1 glucose 1-dehydrogenase [Gammaproteobacteria bacterium]CAJ2376062.1 MAG: Gluconate 5-dehydrogenase [Arenicellales bacterium IbO2]
MSAGDFLAQTFSLKDRVALVTGASSGLGAHFARTLARAGCRLALAARRREKLEELAAEICGMNGERGALTVVMDVNERNPVEDGVARAVEHFGRVDILINNAGVAASGDFLEMREEDWQLVLDTDLSAVWRVAQVAARQMTAQKSGGSIINISSVLGLAAQRRQTNYAAAKAGVIHLTRTMALELGARGVRVNALAPGYFATDMNREFLESKRGRAYIASLPPRRAGELRELDGALLLLAGDAGSYINGSVLVVDGGTKLGLGS